MISIVCEVYQPEGTELVHRGVVFKVMERITNSPLLAQTELQVGDAWQVVRDQELYMNGPFEGLEKRIKELWESEPIHKNASFELKYDEYTDQVRRQYFLKHGFSNDNVPWSGLAKHYAEGDPVNRRIWSEKYKINAEGNTGFSEYAYQTGDTTSVEGLLQNFTPEQMAAAERSADILTSMTKAK